MSYEQSERKSIRSFDENVLESIIGVALESIDGLLSIDGHFILDMTETLAEQDSVVPSVAVEIDQDKISVEVDVVIEYGKSIPTIFRQIKEHVFQEVSRLTAFQITEINVHLRDVVTPAAFELAKHKNTNSR